MDFEKYIPCLEYEEGHSNDVEEVFCFDFLASFDFRIPHLAMIDFMYQPFMIESAFSSSQEHRLRCVESNKLCTRLHIIDDV